MKSISTSSKSETFFPLSSGILGNFKRPNPVANLPKFKSGKEINYSIKTVCNVCILEFILIFFPGTTQETLTANETVCLSFSRKKNNNKWQGAP